MLIKLDENFSLLNIIYFLKPQKVVQSQHMTLKSVISRTLSNATIYRCVKYTIYKSQLLHAPTKRNE